MPVRFGIVCEQCMKLHVVSREGRSRRIGYDATRNEFKAICVPPCPNTIYFQRGMLMPYIVPDEAVQHGYADAGDYRPIARTTPYKTGMS